MEMDPIGQYIMMWMTRAEVAAAFFGDDLGESSEKKDILVGGLVVAFAAHVGLWVAVDAVVDPDGKPLSGVFARNVRPRLVRWELITSATLFTTKPSQTEARAMGFQPPATASTPVAPGPARRSSSRSPRPSRS